MADNIIAPNLANTTSSGEETNTPAPVNPNNVISSGEPTTPKLGLGVIANTSISDSNDNLSHVCDIPNSMKYDMAKLTMSVTGLINSIREELQSLWGSASSSPLADEIRQAIKTIKDKIKVIQKFIRDQLGPEGDIAKFIQSLNELITYITTLPARIAKNLQQCLSTATQGLKEAVSVGTTLQEQIKTGNLLKENADAALDEAINIKNPSTVVAPQKL